MKIYGNAEIYCADTNNSFFRYMGVEKGKIKFLSNDIPTEFLGLPYEDLNGKCILPAFGDNHMHFLSYAYFLEGFDWRKFSSIEDAVFGLKDFSLHKNKNKVLVGFGCSAHSMKEQKLPTRQDLDNAVKDTPVFIIKYDGHAGVGNSEFIKKLPKKVLNLRGADPNSGWFLNDSFFPAADFAAKTVPFTDMIKRMFKASKELAKNGISYVHTSEGVGYPLDLDIDITRFISKFLIQDFKVFFQTMDIKKARLRRLKQIGGCFDTALDGCFGSLDAALNMPYSNDSSNSGILFYNNDIVSDFLCKTHKINMQTALHAIGDKAVDQCVDAFEKAHNKYPRPDRRNILIHGDLVSEKTIEKASDLGLIFAVQPSFLHWNEEPEAYLEEILGNRAKNLLPLRSLIQAGVTVTAGSDAPCTHPNPIHGIYSAVNHPNKDQQISIFEAIKMYTANMAWSDFSENEKGCLKPGFNADFIVLDKNIFNVEKQEIKDIKVESMYINGENVHSLTKK